ncbi:MAG: phosphoribosylamine--glycine ligase [Oscillospiraceae bacterium]|nr:phosphoribosylamine--glycine ligase [Oscillospiraceae bacterium]
MKVLVIGGGGREHAIVKKLKENKSIAELYCLPGNGGIARDALCVPISATDLDGIVSFAMEHRIDFAVVAPDDPLALGAVDRLEAIGVDCFGPRKNAAIIESSKVFAKDLMKRYGIPTARYEVFESKEPALCYLRSAPMPAVIKADGLALGKGVIIAKTQQEAEDAVNTMMTEKRFGKSGERIVIEEYLEGPEVSVLTFTDGKTVVPMVSSMDHKRAGEGDTGPNTGGMGAVAPNPYYNPAVAKRCMETIFLPTIRAMEQEGRPFKGCLYFGLMLTKDGPKVIEYNCRFGDPETQVVLPLLKSDLFTIMRAVSEERLADCPVVFSQDSAVCVIMASKGYPGAYEKGYPISIPADLSAEVFIAGAKEKDGSLVTAGGRVLGVTALEKSLPEALERAYDAVKQLRFENAYYRRDIGALALAAKED